MDNLWMNSSLLDKHSTRTFSLAFSETNIAHVKHDFLWTTRRSLDFCYTHSLEADALTSRAIGAWPASHGSARDYVWYT